MVQEMWQITTIFHNISTYARLQADSPAYPGAFGKVGIPVSPMSLGI